MSDQTPTDSEQAPEEAPDLHRPILDSIADKARRLAEMRRGR